MLFQMNAGNDEEKDNANESQEVKNHTGNCEESYCSSCSIDTNLK